MTDQQNSFSTSSADRQLPEEEGIDIKKYIFLILSHWWWFACKTAPMAQFKVLQLNTSFVKLSQLR